MRKPRYLVQGQIHKTENSGICEIVRDVVTMWIATHQRKVMNALAQNIENVCQTLLSALFPSTRFLKIVIWAI